MNGHLVLEASRAGLSNSGFSADRWNLIDQEWSITMQTTRLVACRVPYYGTEGDVVVCPIRYEELPAVAPDFDARALREAGIASRRDGRTREFCRRAVSAGVQSYFAFLRGQRVTYLGCRGDEHTEWFPGAASKPSP